MSAREASTWPVTGGQGSGQEPGVALGGGMQVLQASLGEFLGAEGRQGYPS